MLAEHRDREGPDRRPQGRAQGPGGAVRRASATRSTPSSTRSARPSSPRSLMETRGEEGLADLVELRVLRVGGGDVLPVGPLRTALRPSIWPLSIAVFSVIPAISSALCLPLHTTYLLGVFTHTRAFMGALRVVKSANDMVLGLSCSKVHTNFFWPFSHRSAGNGSHASLKPLSTLIAGASCTGSPPALRCAFPYGEPARHRSFTWSSILRYSADFWSSRSAYSLIRAVSFGASATTL